MFPRFAIGAFAVIVCLLVGARAEAQTYDMFSYWLMHPHQTATFTQQHWNGSVAHGARAHWRGTWAGREVALAGDPGTQAYDIFSLEPTRLAYHGLFRGNDYGSPYSIIIATPYTFFNRYMSIGSVVYETAYFQNFDNTARRRTTFKAQAARSEVNAHFPTWTDPVTGRVYSDVLQVSYWPAYNPSDPNYSKEIYWLARGWGWVHFLTVTLAGDPATTVREAWVTDLYMQAQGALNTPWVDPFQWNTLVPNGFFEELAPGAFNGAYVYDKVSGWTAAPLTNGILTTDAPLGATGPWKVAIVALYPPQTTSVVYPTACILVTPGATYELSGWIWRVYPQDNAYLDFNDGIACSGGNFSDAHAQSTATAVWEKKSATVTVGPTTTSIRIRLVRDGANLGNAYFDGVTLRRVN